MKLEEASDLIDAAQKNLNSYEDLEIDNGLEEIKLFLKRISDFSPFYRQIELKDLPLGKGLFNV